MTDNIVIRAAYPQEAELLTDIAVRSKAHWGYSKTFMQACHHELLVSEADIRDRPDDFQVATARDSVQGYYSLEPIDHSIVELAALFVSPRFIGQGSGRRLFDHAVVNARSREFEIMTIQSDPYAADFYRAMAAVETGQRESGSIPGRFLPMFEVELA